MKRSLALLIPLLLFVGACAGPPISQAVFGWAESWEAMQLLPADQEYRATEICSETLQIYSMGYGVRGLACGMEQAFGLSALFDRAPVPQAWMSGPHDSSRGILGLRMDADNAFGHYDPAFVRWAISQAVPSDPSDIAATQGVYDMHVQRLGRVYWTTLADLKLNGYPTSVGTGPFKDYLRYLRDGTIPEYGRGYDGGVSMYSLFGDVTNESLAEIMETEDNIYEALYEGATAYGFWLRRSEDGTWLIFESGLSDLLSTYDADWLRSHGG